MTIRELIKRLMNCENIDREIQIIIPPTQAQEIRQTDEEAPYYADILRIYDNGDISICNIG